MSSTAERSPAAEAVGHLEADSEVRTAVGQPDQHVRAHAERARQFYRHDAVELEGIVVALHECPPPVQEPAHGPRLVYAIPRADAGSGTVAQVLPGRVAHDREARITVDDEIPERLVEFHAEAAVRLARAKIFILVGRRDLELEEWGECRPPAIRPRIIDHEEEIGRASCRRR